jgi:DNA-directed RNA polymerase subunit M/transcription elongation factor TFIIS
MGVMSDDWQEGDDLIAAGTICPMPDCGVLAVAYRSTSRASTDDAETWEFMCARCGIEFTAPKSDLIFQSVPRGWLFAKVQIA